MLPDSQTAAATAAVLMEMLGDVAAVAVATVVLGATEVATANIPHLEMGGEVRAKVAQEGVQEIDPTYRCKGVAASETMVLGSGLMPPRMGVPTSVHPSTQIILLTDTPNEYSQRMPLTDTPN
jgi:hypothetical protein